jgi:uncharacterized UPF0160 family protein
VAILKLLLGEDVEVVRTRDEKIIEAAEYVVDVGGVYDPSQKRFDHHQIGGAGVRENGIPYAACGLAWKEYGEKIAGSKSVADALERKIVIPIDAMDNGVPVYKEIIPDVVPYGFDKIIFSFRPSWKEDIHGFDRGFDEAVKFVMQILQREITKAKHKHEGEACVRKIVEATPDKRIIVFEERYPWHDVLSEFEEPLFAVYPSVDGRWNAKAVWKEGDLFEIRKQFPESWAGKRNEELAKVSGVKDAIFCHNKRFIAVASSKEGAIKLATLAVDFID